MKLPSRKSYKETYCCRWFIEIKFGEKSLIAERQPWNPETHQWGVFIDPLNQNIEG